MLTESTAVASGRASPRAPATKVMRSRNLVASNLGERDRRTFCMFDLPGYRLSQPCSSLFFCSLGKRHVEPLQKVIADS